MTRSPRDEQLSVYAPALFPQESRIIGAYAHGARRSFIVLLLLLGALVFLRGGWLRSGDTSCGWSRRFIARDAAELAAR